MKLKYTTKEKKKYTFADLQIGDVFLDENGDIAIKTNNYEGDKTPNSIYNIGDNDEWSIGCYHLKEEVTLIYNAQLVIDKEM